MSELQSPDEFRREVAEALWHIERVGAIDGDFEQAFLEVKALIYDLRRAVESGQPEVERV